MCLIHPKLDLYLFTLLLGVRGTIHYLGVELNIFKKPTELGKKKKKSSGFKAAKPFCESQCKGKAVNTADDIHSIFK